MSFSTPSIVDRNVSQSSMQNFLKLGSHILKKKKKKKKKKSK